MTAAVEEVARNAVSTSEASKAATEDAAHGRSQVYHTLMGISTMVEEISESTETVTELPEKMRKRLHHRGDPAIKPQKRQSPE